ncbi:MAG: hypothetical protein LUC37_05165 [Prevotella sp.]|nr:hypothetical protein [Prevotella sp.]
MTADEDDDRKLWDRQPRETHKNYQYFLTHLHSQLPRTIAKTAQNVGVSENRLNKIARTWKWRKRIDAYNSHINKEYAKINNEHFMRLQQEAIQIEYEANKQIRENLEKLKARQESENCYSPITVGQALLNHERAMEKHVHTYHLICGKPDIIQPENDNKEMRVIHEYQTDKELTKELNQLLSTGSAEKEVSSQQEDKE